MAADDKVRAAIGEVNKEQGGTSRDGDSDPIKSVPNPEYSGHNSAEYGGVGGKEYPGGSK